MDTTQGKELNRRVDMAFRNVKGTAAFWSMMRARAMAMAGTRGTPALFVTISNADYLSEDLRQYLCSLPSSLKDLQSLSLGYLLNAKPVRTLSFPQLATT